MDSEIADYIARGLDEAVMLHNADKILEIPAGELEEYTIRFALNTASDREPLGRRPLNHATLDMLRGRRHGYDPRDIAMAFASWAAMPNRHEFRMNDWLSGMARDEGGGSDGTV
jgi:hypothetical protein